MPLLIVRWPDATKHFAIARLEGPIVKQLVRVVPQSFINAIGRGLSRLLDALPANSPNLVMVPLARLFVAASYVEGIAIRGKK
jgi:hypothetical protein